MRIVRDIYEETEKDESNLYTYIILFTKQTKRMFRLYLLRFATMMEGEDLSKHCLKDCSVQYLNFSTYLMFTLYASAIKPSIFIFLCCSAQNDYFYYDYEFYLFLFLWFIVWSVVFSPKFGTHTYPGRNIIKFLNILYKS